MFLSSHAPRRRAVRALALLAGLLLALALLPAFAIQPDLSSQHWLQRAFLAPELKVEPALAPGLHFDASSPAPSVLATRFAQRYGGSWELRQDLRSDRPNLLQGSGVPLLPGRGNRLTVSDLGLAAGAAVDMDTVEAVLIDFIAENEDLLGTAGLDFALDPSNSTAYGKGDTHWFIAFQQVSDGVPVDNARLVFRISNGNLVQFGSERVAPVLIDRFPVSGREAALQLAWREIGFPPAARMIELRDAGSLRIYPRTPQAEVPGEDFIGAPGSGYEHVLAWRYVFRLADDSATYEVIQDAHTNRVLAVNNLTLNVDATVIGGIYPMTNSDPEVSVPFPFLAVQNGGAKVTDALGMYDYSGGSASTSLDGKYFRMIDGCGSINLSNPSGGDLNLGGSGGTDCVTPGFGGAGNTHASRTGFYHLTRINRKASSWLPANSWLQTKVTANMNVNDTCNASWDGSSMNFYKSGGGCSNTGEIAAVFLHEWGHGLDDNTGGTANENGSGEAVGDIFAFNETKDSCIGPNFRPGVPCYNCDASCTGVRDVNAFSTRGPAVIARPDTVTASAGIGCGRFDCPYYAGGFFPYQGPMGYEGHCESVIASSTGWDLAQTLVDEYGADDGWNEMARVWYGSLVPSKSAYRVASGGTCNPAAQVDGCAASNWYTVFLAADDDDGNLSNSTPNGCRIWDAFDAHGIACGTRPACTSGGAPDFSLVLPVTSASSCAPGSVSYAIDVGTRQGFSAPVTLSVSGVPSGTSASFSVNPVTPGQASSLNLNVGTTTAPGEYILTIDASASGSAGHSASVTLKVFAGTPVAPSLSAPADGAGAQPLNPTLIWTAVAGAAEYDVQVATDAGFGNLVHQSTTSSTQVSVVLQPSTGYWWRVRAKSPCGIGAWSSAWQFTTGTAPFPAPYCPVTFPNGIEPITRVVYADIDNGSPATGGPPLQDFTAVIGHVSAGDSHDLRVEGNTAGNYSTPVKAYADWNRDGDFNDAGESYEIGTLQNSTGVDGQFVEAAVAVPAGLGAGPVRLRVVKRYSTAGDACNSSGYGQAEDYTLMVSAGVGYTVGGSASGLAGAGLVLQLNGAETLPVASDGPFTFSTELADGAAYAVTIAAAPPGQVCSLANASGTIAGADVVDVEVSCSTPTYRVGGSVSGLQGTGLVLQLNGGNDLAITRNGAFAFPLSLADGSAWAVTVSAQPTGQTCAVAGGDGVITGADVNDVTVSCGVSDRIFADGFEDVP